MKEAYCTVSEINEYSLSLEYLTTFAPHNKIEQNSISNEDIESEELFFLILSLSLSLSTTVGIPRIISAIYTRIYWNNNIYFASQQTNSFKDTPL